MNARQNVWENVWSRKTFGPKNDVIATLQFLPEVYEGEMIKDWCGGFHLTYLVDMEGLLRTETGHSFDKPLV